MMLRLTFPGVGYQVAGQRFFPDRNDLKILCEACLFLGVQVFQPTVLHVEELSHRISHRAWCLEPLWVDSPAKALGHQERINAVDNLLYKRPCRLCLLICNRREIVFDVSQGFPDGLVVETVASKAEDLVDLVFVLRPDEAVEKLATVHASPPVATRSPFLVFFPRATRCLCKVASRPGDDGTPSSRLRAARVSALAWRFDTTEPAVMQTLPQRGFTPLPADFRQSILPRAESLRCQSSGKASRRAFPAPPIARTTTA